MGYRLCREIRDFAPGDWSPAELVVALMIADDARDETRRSLIKTPLLCQRTRLGQVTIRGALARMAKDGYEFRVSHGKGSDGRDVFASGGHPPEYTVPLIADIRAIQLSVSLPEYKPP